MKSGKYVGPTVCGTDTAQAQMILNSDNPPREVLVFFEIDFGRTEPNEKRRGPGLKSPGDTRDITPQALCLLTSLFTCYIRERCGE